MKYGKKKVEDYSMYTAAAEAGVTAKQMQALISAQQGEDDAVYMYQKLQRSTNT